MSTTLRDLAVVDRGQVAGLAATVFHQAATFTRHPAISLAWIGGMGAIFTLVVLMMRYRVQQDSAAGALAAREAA